jgi:hypothetical protein
MKKLFFLFYLIFIGISYTQAQVTNTAVPFLEIQPDARASGMGNTGVALANNSAAMYWNPAGLGYQKGNQINITHSKWLSNLDAELFYDYLVGRHYVKGIGTFGAHFTYLNLGHQIHTNGRGSNLGQFSSYSLALGVSYGHRLNRNWAVGTGIRFIHANLFSGPFGNGSRTATPPSSFGVDLAALYKTDPFRSFGNNEATFRAGINISNMGPGVRFSKKVKDHKNKEDEADTTHHPAEPLPTELRIGWAFKTSIGENSSITLTQDYSKIMARSGDNSLQALVHSWGPYTRIASQGQGTVTLSTLQQFSVGTGLEYWYKHLFALRTGYYFVSPNKGGNKFITLGAGIRYDFIGVDISHNFTLKEYGPLANTTRFGLIINF